MSEKDITNDGGAVLFGLVVGWITSVTFYSQEEHALKDLTVILGVIGGAAITKMFSKTETQFSMYCVGMTFGFFIQVVIIAFCSKTWPL